MADVAAEGARLSRLEIEAAARREVHRAVASMVTCAEGRTLTPLRTAMRTLPAINGIKSRANRANRSRARH
jgi:hypothetical protein